MFVCVYQFEKKFQMIVTERETISAYTSIQVQLYKQSVILSSFEYQHCWNVAINTLLNLPYHAYILRHVNQSVTLKETTIT